MAESMKILVVGNCQTQQIAALLSAVQGLQVTRKDFSDLEVEAVSTQSLTKYDLVIAHDANHDRFASF